jgi:hypothetical protein
VIAFALSLTFAVMMLAQPVSAGSMMIGVDDDKGDLMKFFYPATGEPMNGWGDNAPVVKAGYFDMKYVCLAQKGKTYTFGEILWADLPQEGDALPSGFAYAAWILWIDSQAWTPATGPVDIFNIYLWYDGSGYSAWLKDVATGVETPLPFTVNGNELQIEFTAGSINNMASFWWSGGVYALKNNGGYMIDIIDPNTYPGQEYWDIQWPPA